jgi:hypothetical protein
MMRASTASGTGFPLNARRALRVSISVKILLILMVLLEWLALPRLNIMEKKPGV